ncbi:Lysyl oxidase-like protein 3 [Frankliniella fusca]|uniref:protein-lysine 6-oxidase n=1 Tax=Frankliniella fusca TaxID=407009 RepID=A0AAE1HHI5_9NEOP|nr:Lysyl oxidase-like protein 3 [Frankliniella fusca]
MGSVAQPAVLILFAAAIMLAGTTSTSTPARHGSKKAALVRQLLRKSKISEATVRLVGGRVPSEGNVEIHHMGKWGAVCDDEWDQQDAQVVCRQLGFDGVLRVTHSSAYGPSRRRFWMDNVLCEGTERELADCRTAEGWGSSDCTHSESAGVVCRDPDLDAADRPQALQEEEEEEAARPRWKPKTRIKDAAGGRLLVRLAGGRTKEEGRVEVRTKGGEWSLVCGDGWSLLEAGVVCAELGLGYARSAVQTDFFGGNASHIGLSGVSCRGNESSLSLCLHDVLGRGLGREACPGRRENIAAVICTQKIADLVFDYDELTRSAHLEDRQLFFLQCAMEENCLASSAYRLREEDSANWHLETRRLLRFTAKIINAGTEDFRPFIPKHLWEWHACHMHYHSMEVFATFDVLDSRGVRVAEGHKASFCLEDNQCVHGAKPVYACANFGDQGITVNCSDIYRYNIDCQWVDISDLDPGMYTLRVAVNPEFKVGEMTFENNAARCSLLYTESFATVYNCRHERP